MSDLDIRSITAGEMMQRDVVSVSSSDTLRDALELMTDAHVTGLPVMDRHSHCVGMVTASDILNYEQEHVDEVDIANSDTAQHFNPDTQQWESIRLTAFGLEEFGDTCVTEVMTRELLWVECNTPAVAVARRMHEDRVHRLLVMDERGKLFGVVSASDFVRLISETNL